MKSKLTGLFLLLTIASFSQEIDEGKVTFVTSSSVYVRFESTENLTIGDTLFLPVDGKLVPALVIENKSSASTVNRIMGNLTFQPGQSILSESKLIPVTQITGVNSSTISKPEKEKLTDWDGTLSAATYLTSNSIRNMYRASVSADNIHDSKFSIDTYVVLRQASLGQSSQSSINSSTFFNVYRASIRYDATPNTSITLGRTINPKVTSLGPIDGVQAEHSFGQIYLGALAGFRPDLSNHSIDTNSPQFGGYVGYKSDNRIISSTNTLGLLELRNGNLTDRRYTYFQHSSTLFSKLNLFSSFEYDLFTKSDSVTITNQGRLTSLYTSVRYRFSRYLNASISYDNRKRIIYYETYRTELEQLLADDIARQGIRARVNFRPFTNLNVGLAYAKRYQSNFQNPSDNYNIFLSHYDLPGIGGTLSVSLNHNQSGYLRSEIISLRHTREIIRKKLDVDLYAREVSYHYLEREVKANQQYFGSGFNYRMKNKWSLSGLGEVSTSTENLNYRFNFRVIKRF